MFLFRSPKKLFGCPTAVMPGPKPGDMLSSRLYPLYVRAVSFQTYHRASTAEGVVQFLDLFAWFAKKSFPFFLCHFILFYAFSNVA
ncbi:hypothetical protein C7R94_00155 [Brevibacillus sp. NRRL NRS-603]|nr:hypothetical protein C7R94_00155 [Brevibacillus sp. NRRL NRS-603]